MIKYDKLLLLVPLTPGPWIKKMRVSGQTAVRNEIPEKFQGNVRSLEVFLFFLVGPDTAVPDIDPPDDTLPDIDPPDDRFPIVGCPDDRFRTAKRASGRAISGNHHRGGQYREDLSR